MSSKVLVVGSSVVDLTFYTKNIPLMGETVTGKFAQGLGGKGFNQAVACNLSGISTAFITALGKDSFAPGFEKRLNELKIENAIFPSNSATGTAAISVDEYGKNSIIVALGANETLTTQYLSENEFFLKNASVLLMQFETNLEVIDHALKLAKKLNPKMITILNPAPAIPEIPMSILTNVDYLTPNETELEIITGQKIKTDADITKACSLIPFKGKVLATLGERGCYCYDQGKSEFVSAFKVNAIDTSGAGDAFNGAFAAGLIHAQGDWKKAVVFASAAAAISVTRPGTSASMATIDEVHKFYRDAISW